MLTVAEIKSLLEAPTVDDPLYFRDRALLELAYGAGLRVSEWIGIGTRDVLFEEGLVRIFGKGAKERLVPIGRSAIGALAIYHHAQFGVVELEQRRDFRVRQKRTAISGPTGILVRPARPFIGRRS